MTLRELCRRVGLAPVVPQQQPKRRPGERGPDRQPRQIVPRHERLEAHAAQMRERYRRG